MVVEENAGLLLPKTAVANTQTITTLSSSTSLTQWDWMIPNPVLIALTVRLPHHS